MIIDTIFLVGIFFLALLIIVYLIVGRAWAYEVERTPYGRTSNLVMTFSAPPGAKNEFFKEGMIEGKNYVWLEKDFDNDQPTFAARPFLDYVQIDEEDGNLVFDCRLNKQGFPVESVEEWCEKFKEKKEVLEASREEKEVQKAFEKQLNRLREEAYLKQKQENVIGSLKDMESRSLQKISSDMMDEEFAESKYAPKPQPKETKTRKKRVLEDEDLEVLSSEES